MDAKTLDISIPHSLGREEARRRMHEGLEKARQSYAGQLGQVEQRWNGDRLDFAVSSLGQRVSGWVEVRDKDVQIHLLLPWLLARLAERLRPRIEGEARRVLSLPPPEGK